MTNYTLTRLAAALVASTKVAARVALKAAGLPTNLAYELLQEQARIQAARRTAGNDRLARRVGRPVTFLPRPTGRAPVKLRTGTPATRLDAARASAVVTCLGSLVAKHRHGEWSVTLTDKPEAVGITSNQYYTGEKAGKWSIQATDTTITVPADWRVRVQRRGLDIVDGLMTLDAAPLEAAGCELFAATWARRTGTKGVAVDRGYIARSGRFTYHGKTADQALTGLTKKARQLEFAARLDSADLGSLVALCARIRVSVGDAKATGACEYGIRSWCAAVGLDYELGSATVTEVYDAYQREPRLEARATVLRVLRRNRATITA